MNFDEHQAPQSDVHTAEHWDERYSGDQVWSGQPNATLMTEVADLPLGRALDVGCGEGADSVWLAGQGWDVTALDISSQAIARTLAAASAAGVTITAVAEGLLESDLPPGTFDLVSAQYPVLPNTRQHVAERRLLDLVAPRGTLLFVHHEVDREHTLAHGFNPDEFITPSHVRDYAVATGEWKVVTNDRRERHVAEGAGAHHSHDLVVRLVRV
ncbi:methyltransferase domain-containing protein [Kocuria soli]|uniref:Methyltransferase domain-containing protein n=1 Tax=Kocuria soli TaxID=2485125 RepID=A0A3N3ZQX1_9MICC|nr:class I SAM-dependent methyltransferase [Kocuria soli]ROZ63595.1 methyltransferase domain-containing protein [Kocuria soli]